MRRFRVWRHRRKMPPVDVGKIADQVYYLEKGMDEAFSQLYEHSLLIRELERVDVNDLLQRVQELESRATAEANYNESFERI